MQVTMGEQEKKLIKLGILLFRKKFGKRATPEAIHEYLSSLDIPSISSIVSLINKAADNVAYDYQRNMIRNYGELGIWILIEHPDLSDAFQRIFNRITGKGIVQVSRKPIFSKLDLYLMKKILLFSENKIRNSSFSRLDNIESDMDSCSNKSVKYVFDIIKEELETIEDDDIKRISLMYAELFMWIIPRDTAYRDPFFWSLYKVGNPTIKKYIKEHPTNLVKLPKKWYGAVLFDARTATQKLRATGEIGKYEFSDGEKTCVRSIRNRELKKILGGN